MTDKHHILVAIAAIWLYCGAITVAKALKEMDKITIQDIFYLGVFFLLSPVLWSLAIAQALSKIVIWRRND